MGQTGEGRVEGELVQRLLERRPEIEQAALTRIRAIAGQPDAADPAYVDGLYGAVSAAVDFGIASVEIGREPPVPLSLLAQARNAARSGVSLDTVLRRYFAGYSLLGYFLVEEASREGLMSGAELQRLLARLAMRFDHLLAAVGEEHSREAEALRSGRSRQVERIEGLLEGELVDTSEIAYDFAGWHVAMVASGAQAVQSETKIRELAAGLGHALLLLPREEHILWAWFGARQAPDPAALVARASALDHRHAIAFGEPAKGLAGWRFSHRQAQSALSIAQRQGGGVVRYTDVGLLASLLRDDVLAASLRVGYLAPLEAGGRDGGEVLRKTLRAYLAAGGNVSSAAAELGVKRHTVTNRLRIAEESIGKPLSRCSAEIDAALRMQDLEG